MRLIEKALVFSVILAALSILATVFANRGDAQPPSRSAKKRAFEFTYGASIQDLPRGAAVRVWIPVPPTNEHQTIKKVRQSLPAEPRFGADAKYGNKVLYFQTIATPSGAVDFLSTYRVERNEVFGGGSPGEKLTEAQRKLFLSANSKVPIEGKPLELLADLQIPKDDVLRLGRLLYEKVDDHMRYDKSAPGYGEGDAVWACDSRFGNCTDFHSLFISLMRSQGAPARFEIGFPLPPQRGEGDIGGYHCWAFFHDNRRGWTPVDISEADKHPDMKKYYFGALTEDRISFTVGRDITLTPKQHADPLNFFIYPHVEVHGETWPREQVENRFRFKDL